MIDVSFLSDEVLRGLKVDVDLELQKRDDIRFKNDVNNFIASFEDLKIEFPGVECWVKTMDKNNHEVTFNLFSITLDKNQIVRGR